jgi:hypothetical protein
MARYTIAVDFTADRNTCNHQLIPTAEVRLNQHSQRVWASLPGGTADATLETVAVHSRAAADVPFCDVIRCMPECLENVLRFDVKAVYVVEEAIIRFGNHRPREGLLLGAANITIKTLSGCPHRRNQLLSKALRAKRASHSVLDAASLQAATTGRTTIFSQL